MASHGSVRVGGHQHPVASPGEDQRRRNSGPEGATGRRARQRLDTQLIGRFWANAEGPTSARVGRDHGISLQPALVRFLVTPWGRAVGFIGPIAARQATGWNDGVAPGFLAHAVSRRAAH
jgi:hypothetical protein